FVNGSGRYGIIFENLLVFFSFEFVIIKVLKAAISQHSAHKENVS
ncbi:hypothetical protein HMPREF0083_02281, partial [Aneurinibacillus aneurinilyticus ATCC 12856]